MEEPGASSAFPPPHPAVFLLVPHATSCLPKALPPMASQSFSRKSTEAENSRLWKVLPHFPHEAGTASYNILGGWMSYFLGDMRGTNINMAFGWFLWWPRSLPDFTMSHKCVHEAHEEVYHPGDRHFQKSVSSDLTGLNRKEIHPVTRISGLVNSVAPWFHQGARFFPAFSSAILRRLAFLHTGLEMAASVPGFTSSLNNSRWKRNRVLFCIVLFFPLCVLPLFKAKKLLGIL